MTKAIFAYPELHLTPFLSHGRKVEVAMSLEKAVITEKVSELDDRPRTQQACKTMFHPALRSVDGARSTFFEECLA